MMGRTHILIGLSSLWLLRLVPNDLTPDNLAPLAACAALGSLLPDLDANSSTIKHLSIARIQPFAPVAYILSRDLGHRGATHSFVGLAIFSALTLPLALLWPWLFWLALLFGYASHLAADACTKSGIPFLHPHKKRYHLLPPPLRFTTGSLAEDALTPLVGVLVLFLLFSQLKNLEDSLFLPQSP